MITSRERSWSAVFIVIVLVTPLASCGNLPGTVSEPEVIIISGSFQESNGNQNDTADPILAHVMATMHWFTQKLALSIDMKNRSLSRNYLAKIRQTNQSIEPNVPEANHYPVGDYRAAVLAPELEGLRQRLDHGHAWQTVQNTIRARDRNLQQLSRGHR